MVSKINIIFFVFLSFLSVNVFASKNIKIATGSVLEGYYSIGLRLCQDISESNPDTKCEVVPSSGTIQNLELLKSGKVDFALGLSSIVLEAYQGAGHFKESFNDMVQLLRLHDEVFTVIVKDSDKILTFEDLDSQKISNGPAKSDSAVIYDIISSHYNFKKNPTDVELNHEEYANEFCKDNIDAVIMMTGHPNALSNHILHSCEADFISLSAGKISAIIKKHPELHKVTLKSGLYHGITRDYDSVAASAVLVTTKSVDKEIVANFIKYFKGKEDLFKASYPALNDLPDEHFTSGFVIPGL